MLLATLCYLLYYVTCYTLLLAILRYLLHYVACYTTLLATLFYLLRYVTSYTMLFDKLCYLLHHVTCYTKLLATLCYLLHYVTCYTTLLSALRYWLHHVTCYTMLLAILRYLLHYVTGYTTLLATPCYSPRFLCSASGSATIVTVTSLTLAVMAGFLQQLPAYPFLQFLYSTISSTATTTIPFPTIYLFSLLFQSCITHQDILLHIQQRYHYITVNHISYWSFQHKEILASGSSTKTTTLEATGHRRIRIFQSPYFPIGWPSLEQNYRMFIRKSLLWSHGPTTPTPSPEMLVYKEWEVQSWWRRP
jgi:hypothetical protein